MKVRTLLLTTLALFFLATVPAHASTNDSARDCDGASGIKDCIALFGIGQQVDLIRGSITNNTEADFCGTLYISKNDITDWRLIPECVSVADKVIVTWDLSAHDPFDDGTVFCSQFVTDEGVLGGQPCLVMPIPPPPVQIADASGCNKQNQLKQCIFVKGFAIHVEFVRGTEFGIATGSICGYEKRYDGGALAANNRLCVPKGTGSSGNIKWNVNRNYNPGTNICTRYRTDHGTWSGKPCEVIG